MSSAQVYFVRFELIIILIHYDCVWGMVTSFISYLFKWIWFFVFQIKMKNKKQTSNLHFNVQLF